MAALLMPASAIAVGAAVVFSGASASRTSMQAALDSAVLAGVGTSDVPAEQISTATNVFNSNLSNYALSSLSAIKPSFTVSDKTLSGQATASMPNPFGKLVGGETVAVSVKAAATPQQVPLCVLGLNGLDHGAFDINGGPTFNADCAVQANSNSRVGMSQEGKSAVVKAKKFGVKGGHKTETYEPPPSDGAAVVADPYASLPFPAHDTCAGLKGADKKALDIKDDTTLSPGTFCGGIHIDGSSPKVTLRPGIYVMVDGPFWVNGGGIVTGDKVMIAFIGKGAALQVWGNASVKLTSPTSGTYMNMQFFQDRDDMDSRDLWCSIGGSSGGGDSNAKLQIDGVAYFPTQNFWVFGNAVLNANSPSMAVVADKIWTQGNATFNVTHNNPRNLAVSPGPTTTFGARLLN